MFSKNWTWKLAAAVGWTWKQLENAIEPKALCIGWKANFVGKEEVPLMTTTDNKILVFSWVTKHFTRRNLLSAQKSTWKAFNAKLTSLFKPNIEVMKLFMIPNITWWLLLLLQNDLKLWEWIIWVVHANKCHNTTLPTLPHDSLCLCQFLLLLLSVRDEPVL